MLGCWTRETKIDGQLLGGRTLCIRRNGEITGHYIESDGGGFLGGDLRHEWRYDPAAKVLTIDGDSCIVEMAPDGATLTFRQSEASATYAGCRAVAASFWRCQPKVARAEECE